MLKRQVERAQARLAALAEKLERDYRLASDPVERARLRDQLLELAKTRTSRPRGGSETR
jgi:hypothetical protein